MTTLPTIELDFMMRIPLTTSLDDRAVAAEIIRGALAITARRSK